MGLVWVLGNCQDVRVWEDPWVSNREMPILPRPAYPIDEELRVRNLLKEDFSSWDGDLVGALFEHEIRESILNIPLGRLQRPDVLIWKYHKNGYYSVKTAYKAWETGVAAGVTENNEDTVTGGLMGVARVEEAVQRGWNWVWKLKVAQKIQMFLWRCFRNVLPVCSNLIGRYVDVDPMCKRCGTEVETMEHALRDCVWVRTFWNSSTLQLDVQQFADGETPLVDWILQTAGPASLVNQQLFVSLLWSLWFARNKCYFEDKIFEAPFVHAMGQSFVDEYNRANSISHGRITTPIEEVTVWFPPAPGFIKLNIDATVNSGSVVGIGGVARDEGGLMRWCFAETRRGRMEVETSECWSALCGVQLALSQNVRRLQIETDSQILFNALKNPKPDISLFGSLVTEILDLRSGFDVLNFSWIRRVGNSVAHNLASLALSLEEPLFSVSLPTSCLETYYVDLQTY
ncbi:hypothetical protein ACS0TY_008990 [Phlomoides rotata]